MSAPSTTNPVFLPALSIPECLVLQFKDRKIIANRARGTYATDVSQFLMRRAVDTRLRRFRAQVSTWLEAIKEHFPEIPKNAEVSFYTTQLAQCFGQPVLLTREGWHQVVPKLNLVLIMLGR